MSAAPLTAPPAEPVLQGDPVVLAGRVEVFPQVPLPHLNSAAGPAFAARLKGEGRANLYAIICSEGLPWRSDVLSNLLSKNNINLVRFRDGGMIDWPGGTVAGALNMRRYCVVHEQPAGVRLSAMYTAEQPAAPLDAEKLVTLLLKPMVDVISELHYSGISHGSLQPDNLFISAGGVIQAGECASCPPSYTMPPAFLTIERAQAHPCGRGAPRVGDDLYALAATGLIMTLGFNPVAHVPDADLIRLRLERGSFIALLGDNNLKGATTELFRSLLDDDPRRRWGLDEIETWIAGQRPTPRTIENDPKPKRAFSLGEDSSGTRRGVAHLLALNPLKAAASAESGELQRWIERSIESEDLTRRTKSMFERAQSQNQRHPVTPAQLVAKAVILIDPYGPVRYRETSVLPSGFGALLAQKMTAGADTQPLVEVLQAELPTLWTDGQPDNRADHIAVQQLLERAAIYIERKVIGYGLERALYELVPAQSCLSPLIRNANAQNVTQVLRALDRMGESAGAQAPIDRHIAAFLIARDRRIHEGLLTTLQAPDNSIKRVIGMLTLLADAQYRHGPAELKGLAQWMARLLEPATKRFFEKNMQEQSRRELQQAAQKGDLAEMINLLDNPDALDADRTGFEDARVIWKQAEEDIAELQQDIDQRGDVERRVGQPLASGLAVILGIVAIGFVIVLALGNRL